ncbi:hypothetical protein BGS_0257 [Beggiatoa sp. SS]|nr:hypothetical protein BGS_0257 [Beggiatoa sp. SS]
MMIGSALLSHGETPHYHPRCNISLLSSVWYQGDLLHCLCRKLFIFLIDSMNKLRKYNLAVPYSHMGKPHTTSGLTTLHF